MIFDVRGLVMAVLCATVVLMAGFERAEAKIPETSFGASMVKASAVVEVMADAPVRNGDVVPVVGSGFAMNDEINAVLLTKLNDKNAVPEDIFLKEFSLQVDASGRLSGTVRMEGLDNRDREAELLPCAERSNVRSSKRFTVVGNMAEPPRRAAKILANGTVSIDDDNSEPGSTTGDDDGYTDTSEDLDVTGSVWTGSLLALVQYEYSNSDGTGTLLEQTSLVVDNADITDGTLSGYCTTIGPFDVSALSITINVMNNAFQSTESNAMEIAETDPPDYTAAETKTPTTIEVTFNEAVTAPSDNGAACDNWTVTDYAMSSVSPRGSSSTTFTLTVTSAFNRGATPDVNFTTGAEEYEDAQGNDAITVTSVNTTDGCSPAAPTLTLPVNSTIMGGGSVAWTATADNNTTDTS
ncbi:MAG: hypothetical protein KAR36_02420, partial [Candidatus Latescibacteria bacterium]|nr:hypothetical protein [Candidatus Latescibacterota bacterium]